MSGRAEWVPLPAGIVDLPPLFAALCQSGYDGWVSVEDFTAERPLAERVRENLRYLRASAAAASAS